MFLSAALFLLSFLQFHIHFRELDSREDAVIYLFEQDSVSGRTLAEAYRRQDTYRNIFTADKERLFIVTSGSRKVPASHETEFPVPYYNETVDINLLKWMVYIISFLFFTGMMLFFFTKFKKSPPSVQNPWLYGICLLLFLEFIKMELFAEAADFPRWLLPGAWSDLEGWGILWDTMGTQLETIFRYRECPVLINYYQNLTGCFRPLTFCFLSVFSYSRASACCRDNRES